MKNEIRLKIKDKFANKFKAGFPHLFEEAILNIEVLKSEGTIINLVDEKDNFLGRGYYGKQNKGYGWVLTQKKSQPIDQQFFDSKMSFALNQRRSFYQDYNTTAFRVFNGEGDGIGGLTIDYYDGFYLLNWYSQGIYKFKDLIIQSLKNLVDFKGVYQKKRFDVGGKYMEEDDFVAGERGEFPIIVKENGVNFAVYLNEGPMTGIFLDQREVRKTIRDKYAQGKTVLNTFSYTGAFSVFAALGGAKKTTSVDLANRSFPKTVEQFHVNGIDEKEQEIRVMDVFHYFKYAVKKKITFDIVVLDPPSFARSKKHTFSAAKDYVSLLKDTIAITDDEGLIVASTNFGGFGMDKFKGFIDKAFKESKGNYKIIEEFTLPEDFKTMKQFKQGDYLKVAFIRKTT
ncbi:class I SAM-dependent rRNA methyltransferase [Aquibacillus sp. 3ASR75-11]|uniref:Class I SAM-dependent rRNA methyltransferase n=1 Tax=Terrihalobacillus insolitus TaxID=2950438 RepID=A0A9X3WQC7_9BACI|nr:class I SAM-dependent rRNA methyltransferase [Terrihalobacillus insolitus]MDC3414720.1 class I SAM-dependent rRNA methyltransferase [Terrihalobacillus insolitus]MDC3424167.1 class I SAM-dependent rRNA methyltransferase [Terrihalobacillus insolitus]